ncbi:MAG: sigma-70 family RNA polymerase sigma factor [Acidimicrobiales bacterium]
MTGFPVVSQSLSAEDRRREAFERHVVPELEVLLRVATAMTRRLVDAEDLVQDTLLRAYRGIDRFDGASPRAWLLTIMRNAESNRTRRQRPGLLTHPGDATRLAAAEDHQPENLVVGETFDAVVADALDRLPDRFRNVVQLVDLDGLSYAEAASALAIPVGTVMSRLHRARGRIRTRLAAAGLVARKGEK